MDEFELLKQHLIRLGDVNSGIISPCANTVLTMIALSTEYTQDQRVELVRLYQLIPKETDKKSIY